MSAGSDTVARSERRARQRVATQLHHHQAAQARLRSRRARRAGVVTAAAVGVLGSLAGLGAGIGAVLSPGPPPPVMMATLIRQPAVSAVSAVAGTPGTGWLTDDRTDTLVHFDPAGGRVVGSPLGLPGRPSALTMARSRVWVASMVTDTVEEVGDTGTRILDTVPVPAGPVSLATGDGLVWVASVIAGDVTAIDPATGHVVASAHLPGGAVRVAVGAGGVWVTGSTDTVTEIDPRPVRDSLRRRTVTVGRGPLGVAVGDHAVWVADSVSGTVTEIDPVTDRVMSTYRTGPDPVAVAVLGSGTGAGSTAWVADGRSDSVRVVGVGAGPGGVGPAVRLGGTPRQLVAVDGAVWAAIGNPGAVVTLRGA
ncbi:MAG: NHL repeat-containing protein [Acidimicrobiales bacterium]